MALLSYCRPCPTYHQTPCGRTEQYPPPHTHTHLTWATHILGLSYFSQAQFLALQRRMGEEHSRWREQQEQKHEGLETGPGQRTTSAMGLESRVYGRWSHRGCQITGRRQVSPLFPLRSRMTPITLLAKPFTTGSPFSQTHRPLLLCPDSRHMELFANAGSRDNSRLGLCKLLFPFPISLSDECALRTLAGSRDHPAHWPHSFLFLPQWEILDSTWVLLICLCSWDHKLPKGKGSLVCVCNYSAH